MRYGVAAKGREKREKIGIRGLGFRVYIERYGVKGLSSGMELRVYIEQYGVKGLWFRIQARDTSLIPRV